MLCTSAPTRQHYSTSVVAVTLVTVAAVGLAGFRWDWQAVEIATVVVLVAVLAAALAFASRRHVVALESALAAHHEASAATFARSASEAIGKVALYARELDAQYDDAHEELCSLRFLLDDAIAKLVASFSALNDLAQQQRTLAQPYMTLPTIDCSGPSDASATLDAWVEQFDRHVVDVVTTLQFQDIAAQLVDHARARVERTQMLSAGLGKLVATLEASGDARAAAAEADDHLDHVDHVHRVRRMARANPVASTSIAPGDVELF